MKTLIAIIVLLAGFATNGISENIVAKGSSQSELGNYTIAKSDQDNIFNLKYEHSDVVFTIQVCKDTDCCYYLVNGNGITLAYSCQPWKFGVCPDGNGRCNVNTEAGKRFLDELGISRQQKIDTGGKTPENAMGLIACYFHELIKKDQFNAFFELKA